MFSSYTLFVLLSFVSVLNGKQFRCDYTYFPDVGGWMKLHRVPANWFEARLRCHLEGGNLASPTNSSMKTVMKFLMDEASGISSDVFTGIHAFLSRGDYSSIEGVPLWQIPHKWAEEEPDNFKDRESCIVFSSKGELSDVNCHIPQPYICYKEHTQDMILTPCGTIDKDYVFKSSTGNCYKFHTVPRTWSRANMACAAEGGHLVIINSEEEATVVRDLFAKHPAGSMVGSFWQDVAFVGFYDWNEHGEWLTVHGETLPQAGYAKFSPGEPNNSTTGEFCGAVYRSALFDDLWCENHYAFICEKKPDSLLCDF